MQVAFSTIHYDQVTRKEKELECVKRAPAEAESRKVMILAEAQKTKTLALAGAEAAAIKVGSPTVSVLCSVYSLSDLDLFICWICIQDILTSIHEFFSLS